MPRLSSETVGSVTKSASRSAQSPARGARALRTLLTEVRGCTLCAAYLPLGPRPVLQAAVGARLLVVGQAPGAKVHRTGVPWDDPSGDKLRDWLGLDRAAFYNESLLAIAPIGFCYPGKADGARGGDLPPRPECAPRWHPRLRALMPKVGLTLLIGTYAQAYYLGARRKGSLTETVRAWRDYVPFIPMPHPSPRNRPWLYKHPWFEAEMIPAIRAFVAESLR
jgi:uracil-DNA glycosylase